ncbi:MAG: DUF5107 domain-containing protein [Phycisphaerae bacterium]
MKRVLLSSLLSLMALLPTFGQTARADEPSVTVKVEQMTHPMQVGEYQGGDQRGAMYPRKDTLKTIDWTGPLVTLNNGLVEVKIVPTLAMRVLNAIDLTTGRSMAGTDDPKYYETQPFTDVIGWTAGFIEASFPYFEHGTGVRQDAAWRIIRKDDGTVTVAMTMLFTEHQQERHKRRYGRFSQRQLSSWVTLKPGQSKFSVHYRVDNPNPLRRGDRFWTNVLMHAAVYDQKHIIYPVGYYSPHGAGWVKPFFAEGGQRQYRGVSHFGIYPEYRFAGVYSPQADVNHLVIRSADAPGMKLYTRREEGGFLEHWFGTGAVFEDAGGFVGPFQPIEMSLELYQADKIGRVLWADGRAAVGYKDGAFLAEVPSAAEVRLQVKGSDNSARARLEPGQLLKLQARPEAEVEISINGQVAASLPLTFADTTDKHPKVKTLGGKLRIEKESISNHVGAPTDKDAIRIVENMIKKNSWPGDTELLVSLANTCYRYGRFDLVDKALQYIGPTDPDGDFLRGLMAWERGEKVDFGSAGIEANYHRALLAVQDNQTDKAVRYLKQFIDKYPGAFRPQLLLAWLEKDKSAAEKLLAANPASAKALLVLKMLGDEQAGEDLKAMIDSYKPLSEDVRRFRAEITEGKWQHMPRYQPLLKSADK